MLNDRLEDAEIEYQVAEFREKGFYSVIFRTYKTEYAIGETTPDFQQIPFGIG